MKNIQIAWSGLHFGEELIISGTKGSGTIFLSHCNLKCIYCQNWQISQPSFAKSNLATAGKAIESKKYSIDEVVKIMFDLEKKGAHNINFVSPTVWIFWLKEIIVQAKRMGLKIPVVWNSNGYELLGGLRGLGEMKGIDIYLPDYKYDIDELGEKYSGIKNYSQIAREAIFEMQSQVGDLRVEGVGGFGGSEGVAVRGLIVRHLILPGQIENSLRCLRFIRSVSDNVCLSLMSQYNPLFKAKNFPEINRTLVINEYKQVVDEVKNLNFKRGWIQEFDESVSCFNPDFGKANPFGKI